MPKLSNTIGAIPSASLPQNYTYALFNLHDGVTQGTSTSTGIVDSNPGNSWTLDAVNFNAAQWTDKSGWWTGTKASNYALTCNTSSFSAEEATFTGDSAFDGAAYMVACEFHVPAYATSAHRMLTLGVGNNPERFMLRYTTGDVIQFLATDDDLVASPMDITAYVDTDLTFCGLIDDRAGVETLYARVYQAGTTNLIASASTSLTGGTWLSTASARFLQVGSNPDTPTNGAMTGSMRRILLVPFGSSIPSDMTSVYEELALYRLSRFETL